jgi:recombination protein U
MTSAGKSFEQDFKKSVPEDVFYYRFRDGTSSWDKGEMTRFQQTNICDCMMYDGNNLYLLELKSHKGRSIPFTCVSEHQVKDLSEVARYVNVNAGMIFNFRDLSQTYYIPIDEIEKFHTAAERKSFPLEFAMQYGVKIKQTILRTRYKYDIKEFLGGTK